MAAIWAEDSKLKIMSTKQESQPVSTAQRTRNSKTDNDNTEVVMFNVGTRNWL